MSIRDSEPAPSKTQDYGATAAPITAQANPKNFPVVRTVYSNLAVYCAEAPKASINGFCGAMAGVASGVVTCPLDVIKTKLQAQGSFRRRGSTRPPPKTIYQGMFGTARVIWREDGLRGMYRGLPPMLLGYLPTWAVYMTVYDGSREFYYSQIDNKFIARIYASLTAGACSTLVTNPIWVIKTRLMSQVSARAAADNRTPWYYKSTLDAARKMYRTEGIRSFYSGLGPALLGLTHVAIQFPLYEYFKKRFTGLEMGENTTNDSNVHWSGIAAATFLSKVFASSATYPHEVLRTRLQTQQRSMPTASPEEISFRGGMVPDGHHATRGAGTASSDGMINASPRYQGIVRTCKMILQEEGWRAFYNGMGTNLIRAIPAAMTTMLTFEFLKKTLHSLKDEGLDILESEKS